MSKKDKPIFIHSLFRSGSTYIFNVFRHAQVAYWPYQEPLSEWPARMGSEPEKVFAMHDDVSNFLRHPQLDKPYFYEFQDLAADISNLFRKEFVYDQYFSVTAQESKDLKKYLKMLINGALARPVIQECHSGGRVGELKKLLGGIHIFLWRNPWDQWWSYKPGFDTNNLLVANASHPPPFMEAIKKELQIPAFHDSDIFCEYSFFNDRWLDARGSYMLFFALWCHAMLEAYPKCDLAINIDSLSKNAEYQLNTSLQLDQMDIRGLDFSDCKIPQAIYGKSDQDFFNEIEEKVIGIFRDSGYSSESIKEIEKLRDVHRPTFPESNRDNTVVRDALRARNLARHFETEASAKMHASQLLEISLARSEEALDKEHTHSQHLQSEWDAARAQLEDLAGELATTKTSVEYLNAQLGEKNEALVASQAVLDKEQAHFQWLQSEWDTAKAKADELNQSSHHWWLEANHLGKELEGAKSKTDELNQSSHHWWLEADRLSKELQSVYDSKSWKITWPLRKLMQLLRWLFVLPIRITRWLVRLPKRTIRWLLTKAITFILRYPRLKLMATSWLLKRPHIKDRLKLFAQARGLTSSGTTLQSASKQLLQSSSVQETSFTENNAVMVHAMEPIILPLPSGKRKLYYYVDHTIQCPVNTGMQRVTRQLGKALLGAGENIIFVKWNSDEHQFSLLSQVELDYLSQWNGPKLSADSITLYPATNTDEQVLVGKCLLEESHWLIVPEVTHITYQSQPMTLNVLMTAKQLGLKTAFVYYDAIPLKRMELSTMAQNHATYMQQLLLADLIIPISEWSARDLVSYFRVHEYASETTLPTVKVVPLPGESPLSPRITVTSIMRHSSKLILSVGSIEHRKNQLTLVKAFEKYCDENPDSEWKLVLVGSVHHDAKRTLDQAVQKCKRIKVFNNVSDIELDKYYRECAFTVFPSIEEGFGLPILESLWYAKPCICANFGAMREVAAEGGCLMVDTQSSDVIFDAIEELTNNSDLLENLSWEATSRSIETWADYGAHFISQINDESTPLTQIGSIYYFIDHTCTYPGNSGIQRVVRGLARSLMENGLNLIPVKWDENNMCFYPPSETELEHMSLWNGPPVKQWRAWLKPEKATMRDWVLVPELTHNLTSEIILYTNQVKLRCAYVFYDTIPWKMRDIYAPEATEAHRRYMQDLNDCEKIFPISQYSRSELMAFLGSSKLHTPSLDERLQACILPGEFLETDRTYEVKSNNSETIKILCVGTIEPRKNHLTLLQAFKQANEQSSKTVKLVLAGGDLFPDLSNQVNHYVDTVPNILWEKSVDDTRLQELYAECDFTVYPSLEEGFGLPILESLWHARPCICRDLGAMHEVSNDGGCLTVETANSDALAQAILQLIEDNHLRLELARECTEIQFKTWLDYGREIATYLAAERFIPVQKNTPRSMERIGFYDQMININPRPLLSICISTYNRADWLSVGLINLERLLPEFNPDIEIVVCDNTSTDCTPEIVEPYLKRKDFHYYCNPENVGMLGNLRVTAHHATGNYIWILGDDDLIKPGCIEKVLEILKINPELALVYLNYAYHRQDDIKEIKDFDKFMAQATPVTQPGRDIKGAISEISTESENFFTAIYCLIFRRDHALQAYSQDTAGRPFSTMLTCIPTTYHVLNYMMDEHGYWIGEPQLVVNLNVSWMKYATLWILERLPEAHDLAEKMGADRGKMDAHRNNHLAHIVHWFREIYYEDKENNIKYFSPERLIFRINHLGGFSDVVGEMRECYETAHQSGNKGAKFSPSIVFHNTNNAN